MEENLTEQYSRPRTYIIERIEVQSNFSVFSYSGIGTESKERNRWLYKQRKRGKSEN